MGGQGAERTSPGGATPLSWSLVAAGLAPTTPAGFPTQVQVLKVGVSDGRFSLLRRLPPDLGVPRAVGGSEALAVPTAPCGPTCWSRAARS